MGNNACFRIQKGKHPTRILGEMKVKTSLEDEMDFNRQKRNKGIVSIPKKRNELSRSRGMKMETG